MNYNKLAEEAHENAVKHGFWETKVSNEHCLMLVITEIAEMCGFDEPLYFSRVFKKNFGCSPSNYARMRGKYTGPTRTELNG